MTTCVNPTNTVPGTFTNGGFGTHSSAATNNPYGAPTNPQSIPGYFNSTTPNGYVGSPWPTNTVPSFYGQPYQPGSANTFPAPQFNPALWMNAFGFNTPQWPNPSSFNPAPWTNPYAFNPYTCATPGFTPMWNNGFVAPTNTFNPTINTGFNTGFNTYPGNVNPAQFNPWNAQANTPQGFTQSTPWQTPWNWNFNPAFINNGTTPFVGNYTAPITSGFVSPITTAWANIAAAINTLSQPNNWSPFTTPNFHTFNTTPWNNGFPTFGGFNPATQPTFGLTPAFTNPIVNPIANPWSNTIPTYGFNPFAATPFNPTFGTTPFPTGFANTPWPNTPSFNGGFNPTNFNPFFPGQFAPGFTPQNSGGYAPIAQTNAVPTTRTNPQNGDGGYRNAV